MQINPQFQKNAWTGLIGDSFTTSHVKKAAAAIGQWMKDQKMQQILIGYDSRFGGALFAEAAAKELTSFGLQVYLSDRFITSPMMIYNMVKREAEVGLMITASSLGSQYSGIKLFGIGSIDQIEHINQMITASESEETETTISENSSPEPIDFETPYLQYMKASIDFDSIKSKGLLVVFDAMYGASQKVFAELLPASIRLRCEENPSFKGDVPNPTAENLTLLSSLAKGTEYAVGGLATNCDGEALAMCDEEGNFINPYEKIKQEEQIPWRDALFIGFKLIEKMAITGQKLSEL